MVQDARTQQREKVIEVLHRARSMELHAIHQYMNQHYNLDNQDYGEMAAKVKLVAIDEMRHAELFADRLEKLGAQPTTDLPAKVLKGQNVEAIFPFDANLEDDTIVKYNQFLMVCRENSDSISMKLFEAIIDEEQVHFDYFDSVRAHIENLDGTYLAKIAGTSSATGLQTQGFVARQGGGTPQRGA
ncbi:MAG: Bacterioferritin [Syntrophorhabdus sp. PtaU1.Bin153]|nr:MAG: Bacterioferritin [Syntrophorhabdus sp. PtaU1.Bin153]